LHSCSGLIGTHEVVCIASLKCNLRCFFQINGPVHFYAFPDTIADKNLCQGDFADFFRALDGFLLQ
jgi:hypothetical protein